MTTQLRIATVITRMTAGAGGVALRGALALDPDRYETTVIAGATGLTGAQGGGDGEVLTGVDAIKDAPPGDLLAEAYAAGLQVMRVRSLVPQISPWQDRTALRTLTQICTGGGYDIVHTHSAKAGALGRLAAVRTGVPRVVHTLHGFPFHQFQPWGKRAV